MRLDALRPLFASILTGVLLLAIPTRAESPKPPDAPERKRTGPTAAEWREMAKAVQTEVEELRGWKFKTPVKTDVHNEEQLRGYLHKKLFDEMLGDGRLERLEAMLRMVGLIPPKCDLRQTFLDVLLNQIGGFYDPQSKTFFMLQRDGTDYGPLLNRTLVAHELTHALDDQYVDLEKLAFDPDLSEDAALAAGAVIEGSATALMTRYMTKAMQSGDFDAGELAEVQAREMERSEPLLKAPPYFSALIAQYLCGMFFVLRGDIAGLVGEGNESENVLAALKDPPRSTEQILHPEKYWQRAHRDEPIVVDDAQLAGLLERDGWKVLYRNTIGELLCALLAVDAQRPLDLIAAGSPAYWTNEAATGWGGDRFFLLSRKPDAAHAEALAEPRGVWITAWDSAQDRDEFLQDYEIERELAQRRIVKLSPRVAVFLFGYDDESAATLAKQLEAAGLRFTRGGKPWQDRGE